MFVDAGELLVLSQTHLKCRARRTSPVDEAADEGDEHAVATVLARLRTAMSRYVTMAVIHAALQHAIA